ncbi:MAG: 1-acyl-sn-glycerol-3-phosphate acyltransferase [Ruminococcaceae bacterium]|nr:1-acyl-sn-glycerol-3-phosphate acyltransferase [Oscillospiraceae bacterium]
MGRKNMKIKTKNISFEKIAKIKRPKHFNPVKPNIFFRTLIRVLSQKDLMATKFTYTKTDMEKVGDEPCLILMNHSSFLDFEIAYKILYPKPFCVVATTDAFVSKGWLMRLIGCIPTQKFVTDVTLINDMEYALKTLKIPVLMYPEAGYSFDGCATSLPRGLGRLLKKLDVPVVSIHTDGVFLHQPLYNCLKKRKIKASADIKCILSKDEVREKSVQELDEVLEEAFTFDSFDWQYKNKIEITEPYRAEGLNRILYKCASCMTEGMMEGKGTSLKCHHCGKEYELDKYGRLNALNGETEFSHIPDWYNWERECVKKEIADGTYKLDTEVDICVLVDYKALYRVGEGRLTHDKNGFKLVGCDGKLEYTQKPLVSHSLNSDYYWYEIGDIISIGNKDTLYYCFPKGSNVDVVAKTRIAAEELYKTVRPKRAAKNEKTATIES